MYQLIIQTAFVGDLLLSIPLIRAIHKHWPDRKRVLVTRKGLGDFFLKAKLADTVIEVSKSNADSYRKAVRELNTFNIEHIFCPHTSVRSAWLARRVRHKGVAVGFQKWWNFWAFDQRVARPMELPDAARQFSLLTSLLAHLEAELRAAQPNTSLQTSVLFTDRIPEVLSLRVELPMTSTKPTVFLAPGSVWSTKRWPIERFKELARTLIAQGLPVTLIGSADERDVCETIKAEVPEVMNFAGQKSLYESIAHLQNGIALVTNDSGAMHMAAVAGCPTVAIFGPTVLALGFRPWQTGSYVAQSPLPCRPCGKHGAKSCPIGTHACMKNVSLEDVLKGLKEVGLKELVVG